MAVIMWGGGNNSPKANYGWISNRPSAGPFGAWIVDVNTLALWHMDEALGDIIDEVASITVADVGSPTYSVPSINEFVNWSPGITFGIGNYFQTLGVDTHLDLGTSDATIQVAGSTSSTADQLILDCIDGTNKGYWLDIETNGGSFKYAFHLGAEDGTTVDVAISGATAMADGNLNKLRCPITRTSNFEVIRNGSSEGLAAISGLSGKNIICRNKGIGVWNAGANLNWRGTLTELKISNIATANDGGPNGG